MVSLGLTSWVPEPPESLLLHCKYTHLIEGLGIFLARWTYNLLLSLGHWFWHLFLPLAAPGDVLGFGPFAGAGQAVLCF